MTFLEAAIEVLRREGKPLADATGWPSWPFSTTYFPWSGAIPSTR